MELKPGKTLLLQNEEIAKYKDQIANLKIELETAKVKNEADTELLSSYYHEIKTLRDKKEQFEFQLQEFVNPCFRKRMNPH